MKLGAYELERLLLVGEIGSKKSFKILSTCEITACDQNHMISLFSLVPTKLAGYYHIAGYNFKSAPMGELSKSLGHSIQMYEKYLALGMSIIRVRTSLAIFQGARWYSFEGLPQKDFRSKAHSQTLMY